jgi:hypothetical protein
MWNLTLKKKEVMKTDGSLLERRGVQWGEEGRRQERRSVIEIHSVKIEKYSNEAHSSIKLKIIIINSIIITPTRI